MVQLVIESIFRAVPPSGSGWRPKGKTKGKVNLTRHKICRFEGILEMNLNPLGFGSLLKSKPSNVSLQLRPQRGFNSLNRNMLLSQKLNRNMLLSEKLNGNMLLSEKFEINCKTLNQVRKDRLGGLNNLLSSATVNTMGHPVKQFKLK
jgi:hypothetical protein